MLIYRIEHSAVLRDDLPAGPYSDLSFMEVEHEGIEWYEVLELDCDDTCLHVFADQISWVSGDSRPTPTRDNLWEVHGMLFGFPEMNSLIEWFGQWFHELNFHGFVVAVYDAKEVRHGSRQSVFDPETATRIHDMWVPPNPAELV